MFTSIDKAIGAFLTSIVSILVLTNVVSEGVLTPEMIAGIAAIVTAGVTYVLPNKK